MDREKPDLISPPRGATGVSLTPTLEWTSVPLATAYRIQIDTDDTFPAPVILEEAGTSHAVA